MAHRQSASRNTRLSIQQGNGESLRRSSRLNTPSCSSNIKGTQKLSYSHQADLSIPNQEPFTSSLGRAPQIRKRRNDNLDLPTSKRRGVHQDLQIGSKTNGNLPKRAGPRAVRQRSVKQTRQPEVPARRSARLNLLRQTDATGKLHPLVQNSTNPTASATAACHEAFQTKELGSPPQGRKQAKEHHERQSCKRPRLSDEPLDPIDHWRRSGFNWPKRDWSRKEMDRYLARKKSTATLRRKRSESELGAPSTGSPSMGAPSTGTPSDQKTREQKSAGYRDARYNTLLAAKGSFMDKSDLDVVPKSKVLVQNLLDHSQSTPQMSLFHDDIFETTCRKVRDRNESRVIRDISPLIVPAAENLSTYESMDGSSDLACLIESVNEGWNNSMPFTKTRPQPDYAVGFRREAFSEDRLQKLEPFVGDIFTDVSFFLGTYYQYFPFLTCEVKCGAAALDVADRQNAHSMTLAVRGVVELFRLVGREKELDREILAFSISHDHRLVRIYGHYAIIGVQKDTFYRYPIREFSFTELEGKDKWTAYKFTKNVYKTWMPEHFKRLCSAIDAIPAGLDFGISQSELRFSDHSGLSQDVADHHLSELDVATTTDHSSQLELVIPETPDTSFTQTSGQTKSKKQKKKI